MKQFALAVVLIGALSSTILAGNMPTVGAVGQPPPPGETHTPPGETHTPPGEIQTPPEESQGPNILVTVILTIITLPR